MLGFYERAEINDKSAVINWIDYRQKALARARHESINRRPKQFGCMKQEFRHTHLQHKQCFGAILVLIQIDIERAFSSGILLNERQQHTIMVGMTYTNDTICNKNRRYDTRCD